MSDSHANRANKAFEIFEQAKRSIQELAERVTVSHSIEASDEELSEGLNQLFQGVKSACEELSSGRSDETEAMQAGIRRDVLDTWQDLHQHHLPVSLALLRKRFAALSESANGNYTPTKDRHPVLLLMAGYSIEQLVLCIAINYYERGVRHVVPFAGKTSVGGHSWQDEKTIKNWLQCLNIYVGTEADCEEDSTYLRISPPILVAASNPANVFQKILTWWRGRELSETGCLLDVTGGQKPMDSGASYAAMYLDCDAWYLDFTDYDGTLRRPTPDSLRYVPLMLPSVAFSHNARREVVTHFRDRRFRSALERVSEIVDWGNQLAFREYFPQEDLNAFGEAAVLIRQCVALMGANYPADCLESLRPSLHDHFKNDEEDKTQGMKKQKKVEPLRDKVYRLMRAAESDDLLLDYVCDEYWRLETLLRLAEGDSKTNDLQVTYSEGVREVIVGSVGLSELIVDALLLVNPCELTISAISGVARVENRDAPPEMLLGSDTANYASLLSQFTSFPKHRFPPGWPSAKAKLLRGKPARFSVWSPATKHNSTDDKIIEDVVFSIKDLQECDENKPKYVLDCELRFAEPFVEVKNTVWERSFGNFGCNNSRWFDTRHLIAHMRAPMQHEQFALAQHAIDEFLPRFIGLLAAVRTDPGVLPMDAETTKVQGTNILSIHKNRIPWYAPNAEKLLCQQLRLPVQRSLQTHSWIES